MLMCLPLKLLTLQVQCRETTSQNFHDFLKQRKLARIDSLDIETLQCYALGAILHSETLQL